MNIEEIYDLELKYQEVYKRTKDYTRNDFVIELIKKEDEKQELIEYLKDLIENRFTNGKVVWFDPEFAKIYGELCSIAGAGDTRLALVPLSEVEEILSKIEKSNK